MIKAGANGSGISDVVYMGDVVNSAARLAHKAGRLWGNPIWVGSDFYGNLNEHNQELCTQQYDQDLASVYTSTAVLTGMNSWIDEQSTRPNAYCPEV